jgi:hypothetical protein
MINTTVASMLLLIGTSIITSVSADDGYQPPNTLIWPLRNQNDDQPRPAVWNSFGEYQNYLGSTPWLHSGFDSRGVYGDRVRVVDDGNVWMVANLEQCNAGPTEGSECRIYVLSRDERYIYYYSHLYLGPETDYTSTARAQIEKASTRGAASHAVKPDTEIYEGDTLAFIADFDPDWDHLHFGIIAAQENYDMVNPLTALSNLPIDDEPPTIDSLAFYLAGTPESSFPQAVKPQGACDVISGNLDIVAVMQDTFYTTNPAPADLTGGVPSTGVYEARYLIRPATSASPEVNETWYRFDRAPLSCAGSLRGTSCPSSVTLEQFFSASIEHSSNTGGARWGESYASILYSNTLSNSTFNKGETYAHILTNSWGIDGSWDTAAGADGLYQVSVEAGDHAGNLAARSRFVYVHNSATPFDQDIVQPDSYVRDNTSDIGALPSTLGGLPFWTSPDIIILRQGSPVPPIDSDFAGTAQVTYGTPYDVYVRVHNDRCNTNTGVSTKVYSANPSMIIDQNQWVELTGGSFVGSVDVPAGGKALLGPFTWIPTEAEAIPNAGHRCMLAYITSAEDSHAVFPDVVKDNNNIAQRNLQVGLTSFSIYNPELKEAWIEIGFDCNDLPIHERGTIARLNVDYHPLLADGWTNVPGTILDHDQNGNRLRLDLKVCRIKMPAVNLPAQIRLPASVDLAVGSTTEGTFVVDFSEHVNGEQRGGMSFSVTNVIVE